MIKKSYRKSEKKQEKSKNITEVGSNKININWYPGHMEKTKRLIKENYDLIDIVYEVIDARIPYSSKNKEIELLISNKPRILIMTKSDLCDLKETNKWVDYYNNKGYYVLLLDLTNNKDYLEVVKLTKRLSSKVFEKRNNKGLINKEIRALVVGIPNVGKSTLINQMASRKVAAVGNTPGVTKSMNWLKTKHELILLDTPGILWPKIDRQNEALNLAAMSAIRNEVLPLDDVAVYILKMLASYYPNILKTRYMITEFNDIEEVYNSIAKNLNIYKKGYEIDYDKISQMIVNDVKNAVKGITFDRFENEKE